ncbi:transposase, partial [Shigella flexneri]
SWQHYPIYVPFKQRQYVSLFLIKPQSLTGLIEKFKNHKFLNTRNEIT